MAGGSSVIVRGVLDFAVGPDEQARVLEILNDVNRRAEDAEDAEDAEAESKEAEAKADRTQAEHGGGSAQPLGGGGGITGQLQARTVPDMITAAMAGPWTMAAILQTLELSILIPRFQVGCPRAGATTALALALASAPLTHVRATAAAPKRLLDRASGACRRRASTRLSF